MRKRAFLIASVVAVASFGTFGGSAMAGDPKLATPVAATLTGEAVEPSPGDDDGSGSVNMKLYPSKNKICYRIDVSDVDAATAAHLHKAPENQTGPVILKLGTPVDGTFRECRRGLERNFIRKIKANPPSYYVDVHTAAFSDGALRGQLSLSK